MFRSKPKPTRSRRVPAPLACLALSLALAGSLAGAQETAPKPAAGAKDVSFSEKKNVLDAVVKLRVQANREAAELQKQIGEISDETDALAAQHRTAVKQVEALRGFNDQMRVLIDSQQAELGSVADQLDRVEEVGRNVMPLMLRMIDALESFVELDVPFLLQERRQRIADLRTLMERADVTSSTKFRQIMEAYQTENEYGRTIEAYRSQIELGGSPVIVDLLRFGRIALMFQTLDGSLSGSWDAAEGDWQHLDPDYGPAIRRGLRVARKLEPPDLIQVPLPPPAEAPADVAGIQP